MKKIYMAPVQKVVEIDTTELLAESQLNTDLDDTVAGGGMDNNFTKELSSSSLWDKEW